MRTLDGESAAALTPVRAWLAGDAEAQAGTVLAEAEDEARRIIDDSDREAAAIRADARRRGRALATASAREQSMRVGRQARSLVLAAAARIRERVQTDLTAAAEGLPSDPRYPALRERLVQRGRALLGEDAQLFDAAGGGVVLVSGQRSIDLSMPTLVAQAMTANADWLEELWRS